MADDECEDTDSQVRKIIFETETVRCKCQIERTKTTLTDEPFKLHKFCHTGNDKIRHWVNLCDRSQVKLKQLAVFQQSNCST